MAPVLAGMLLSLAASQPARAQSSPAPVSPDGVSRTVARQANLEGRVLWLDGTANLQRLSTREGVAAVFDRCVKARINTVVVDVKPLSGHVLYDSKIAPRLTEWRGFRYPAGHDLLRVAVEEGKKRSLKVYANMNVFSDGHKLVRSGPVYARPELQSVIYDVERTLTTPRNEQRRLAVGANRGLEDGEISVYDSGYRAPRVIARDESYALVLADRVASVGSAAQAPRDGITIPGDGYLLVGSGEGGKWLLQHVRSGDTLSWTAAEKLTPILDARTEPVAAFVNPANPVSRDYLLKIVEEIASGYEVDGIVFDRMRYASLHSDFSEVSRQKFEEHIGKKLERFPADVYSFDPVPGRPMTRGPYFKQWLEWRARTIRTWLEQASAIVRQKRPGAKVAAYVGSWYDTYYTVGVNWGSEEFMPAYEWMSPTYSGTGYAHLLDWITTGCYHPVATREQAKTAGLDQSYTVQAAAELSTRAVTDSTFVYAGLYVLDYREMPESFRQAIRAAREYSHGVMLFDLVHVEEYGWWDLLAEEFAEPRTAPHDVPGLLTGVRALRKALSAGGPPPATDAAGGR